MRLYFNKHYFLISLVTIALLNLYYFGEFKKFKIINRHPTFSLQTPYNQIQIPLNNFNINDDRVIDTEFELKINPKVCSDEPFLLIIIVSSDILNNKHRLFVRDMWARSSDAVKIVFALGVSDELWRDNDEVNSESDFFEDIIQGDFLDTFHNLTYKHIMGLKWVIKHCNTARYVVKTDDDTFINYRELMNLLIRQMSPWGAQGLIAGLKWINGNEVIRNASNAKLAKWIVPVAEYALDMYPPYCSGGFILYSQDVLPYLVEASETTKYLSMEDVFATGVIPEKLYLSRTNLRYLVLLRNVDNLPLSTPEEVLATRTRPFAIGPFNLRLEELKTMWKLVNEAKKP